LADYVEVDFTTTLTSATILVAINGWLFSTWTRRDTVRQNQQDRLMRIVRNTRDDVVFMYIVAVIALYYLLIFLLVKMGQPSLPSIFILSLILAIPPALVVGMVLHVLLAMVIIDVCTENPQMCT
jgi:sterol desaturase/sphingolipid hydroxylase (fatty acid hydroxylase superfamily)